MARKKEYVEEEVIDKAMQLFWRKGYEKTSMQMLEKEMDINKFSIYSSFGNKKGLFLRCMQSYNEKVNYMLDKFRNGTSGIDDIKQFFYDSVELCHKEGSQKGCLISNTYFEFADNNPDLIKDQMDSTMVDLKNLFVQKLKLDVTKDEETVQRQANFLFLAKHGLVIGTKVNSKQEIKDYIELTFRSI